MAATSTATPEERALRRARYRTDLLWHAAAFLIINASFVVLDLVIGQSGLQWSLWIAGFWGFGLAFHVAAYLIGGREDVRLARMLDQERRRESVDH
jgi:hypothetical protein